MGSLGRPANRYMAGEEIMIIDYLLQHDFTTSSDVLTTAIIIGVLLQIMLDTIKWSTGRPYLKIPICEVRYRVSAPHLIHIRLNRTFLSDTFQLVN